MPQIRTSRVFTKLPGLYLSAFAGSVITGLTNNPDFPTPLVTLAELGTTKASFDNPISAAAEGGTLQTAQKDAARAAFVTALNKKASYVDINCNENLVTLRSSGFQSRKHEPRTAGA